MDASVVIACRNGAALIGETLEAVLAQEWDRPWEVILADNGSTDDTVRVFETFAARHPEIPMRVVDASGRPGKAFAMNVGVAAAAAPAIIVCDSDDVPAPGWLRAMGEALRAHDLVAARSEVRRLNHGPLGSYREIPGDGVYQLPFAPYCESIAGALMGFTRRLHAAVGGFSDDLRIEDDAFCIRAHLAGFAITRVPEAVVHYRLRQDLPSVYRQARHYGEQDVALSRQYRHTGPNQVGSWSGLLREAWRVAGRCWHLRLRHRSPDLTEQARLEFELGALAGQVAGIVRYRVRPTFGRPPARYLAGPAAGAMPIAATPVDPAPVEPLAGLAMP